MRGVITRGMKNSEINEFLKNVKTFHGCFPSDRIQIHQKKQLSSSIIVNTKKYEHPGEHWVAIRFKKDVCFYFDSFGLPVLEKDILDSLQHRYNKIIYNTVCIQDLSSKACGMYCIAFIKNVHSKKSFDAFIKQFSWNDLKKNDYKAMKLMSNIKHSNN